MTSFLDHGAQRNSARAGGVALDPAADPVCLPHASLDTVAVTPTPNWVRIDDRLIRGPGAGSEAHSEVLRVIRWCARRLRVLQCRNRAPSSLLTVRQESLARVDARISDERAVRVARVYVSVLCDLADQGWALRVGAPGVYVCSPPTADSPTVEKERVRTAHLIERDNQLTQTATRQFLREMERRRPTRDGWKSIFSLMRDGRGLAEQLRTVATLPDPPARTAALRACIDPYIQIVEPGAVDKLTGLRLMDIWRYFRHTWTTAYNSTPGRKLFILIRDRAIPDHPVIGIAALGSAIVQMKKRDHWIGWKSETFLDTLRAKPTAAWARWVERSLESLIGGIYVRDLIADGVVTRREVRVPTPEAVARLREAASKARQAHHLHAHAGKHKAAAPVIARASAKRDGRDGRSNRSSRNARQVRATHGEAHWRRQAKTYLFRAKRAGTLADLLEVRLRLSAAGFGAPTREALARALQRADGRRAIQTILRHVRAAHVGVDMMDITVCGAVAPYNVALGGKLVSMLMASPEIIAAYTHRYRGACSVIASSMAARPVRRTPRLVFLGTTSLYGITSTQYNRLSIPAEAIGSTESIWFKRLGRTAGFGSYHFSRETMRELETIAAQARRGREVNNIFGEGVNPKLRKVRSALDAVGLPSEELLQHGSPRLIYGVALAANFREVLLGVAKRPRYLVPQSTLGAATRAIADHWMSRWLLPRLAREDVLALVASHTLAYPVTHGARVRAPDEVKEGEGQGADLFSPRGGV